MIPDTQANRKQSCAVFRNKSTPAHLQAEGVREYLDTDGRIS